MKTINGMSVERYLAAQLLSNSSLKGKKYYDKEDEYTAIIEQNIALLTKSIEDAAVQNFAEMLTDYAEGVQSAGYDGIGVEDIRDKLYEYINWDKKYTPEYEAGKNNR